MLLWQVVQNVRCNSVIIPLAMVGGEQMLWTSVKFRFAHVPVMCIPQCMVQVCICVQNGTGKHFQIKDISCMHVCQSTLNFHLY